MEEIRSFVTDTGQSILIENPTQSYLEKFSRRNNGISRKLKKTGLAGQTRLNES